MLLGDLGHFVVIDLFGFAVDAVGDEVEPAAGHVDFEAVAEVSAVAEFHAHGGVTGLEEGVVGGDVGLGAGVGLDVGVGCAKEGFGAVDGDGFDLVDEFAAAVVALAGIALGVFVGEDGAHRVEDGGAGVVFGCDHFQRVALAIAFPGQGGEDFGIGGGQGARRWGLNHGIPL